MFTFFLIPGVLERAYVRKTVINNRVDLIKTEIGLYIEVRCFKLFEGNNSFPGANLGGQFLL